MRSHWQEFRERPEDWTLDPHHDLAKGLVFAGLGGGRGSDKLLDASGYGNSGTLTNMDPATDWVWVPELGRWGLDFDAVNDAVNLGAGQRFLAAGRPYCIAWWEKVASTSVAYPNRLQLILGSGLFLLERGLPESYAPLNFGATGGTYLIPAAAPTLANSVGIWRHWVVQGNNPASHTAADHQVYVDGVPYEVSTSGGYGSVSSSYNWLGKADYDNAADCVMADVVIAARKSTASEISALANPSNVMLSGLILPPARRLWAAVTAGPGPSFNAGRYVQRRRQLSEAA